MLDVNAAKKRFNTLNRDRLNRLLDGLRGRQRDVMEIMALLFHTNHPTFPGFVSKNTPVGVSDYSPNNRALETSKKLVRSFEYQRRALHQYDIHSIFVMGSGGTIAYTDGSDFDIWLCHRQGLSEPAIQELQKKATAIEKWAASFNLEVHFFLMDAEVFKQGTEVDLSVESSGTAQHYLLLDEFYRTGILMAGRYPVWWLVPPKEEKNYENFVQQLKIKRFIKENESIDFGGFPNAPVSEFFGAALWQLYKSVDSPYKAVLKLMLMEVYAEDYPDVEMLSMSYKKGVYSNSTEMSKLDPYVMLYKKIEYYLKENQQSERLEFVRRCFYFKVDEKLGKPDNPRYVSWQREAMREIVETWFWDEDYLNLLDSRGNWKIDRVLEERKSIVSALTQSYKFLSDFARQQKELSKISQRDLSILGRKLYAALERKAGKIEIVNNGVSDDVLERNLTLQQVGDGERTGWRLYQGDTRLEDGEEPKPLKRSRSIIELLAWCFMNKVMDETTAVALFEQGSNVDNNVISSVIRSLNQLFPEAKRESSSMEDFIKPPRLFKAAIFINIGKEPLMAHAKEGKHLTTSKTDALSYGGVNENLVLSCDLIVQTSWQEVLTFRYEGDKCLFECLNTYYQWEPAGDGELPVKPEVFCFSSGRGMTIARRVEDLIADLSRVYFNGANMESLRYVLSVGREYYLLYLDEGALCHRRLGAYNNMLRDLSAPRKSFSPVFIDRFANSLSALSLVYGTNKPDVIQLFYLDNNNGMEIFIVDEKGSLYNHNTKDSNDSMLLAHYKDFIESICNRINIYASGDLEEGESSNHLTVEFYQILKQKNGKYRAIKRNIDNRAPTEKTISLQVVGDVIDENRSLLTVYCNDEELTSLELGDQVFHEVAKYIQEKRKSGASYPIHISDLDLPGTLLGEVKTKDIQMIHYLNYKKYIEEGLNAALIRLVAKNNVHVI